MSETPHDCYWPGCGGDTYIMRGSPTRTWVSCKKCDASGPVCERERPAIEAWNSLASRLKPMPKVVTIKRWVNVYHYPQGGPFNEFSVPAIFGTKDVAILQANRPECFSPIDTVEVEIKFTDSRGV